MKTLTYLFFCIFCSAFTIISCIKDRKPLSWEVDGLAPLIYGELSVKDLLKDSLLNSNNDNSVELKFSTNLYKLDFNTLVEVPDTSIKNDYTIPFSAGITFSPGQTFITEPENISLDFSDVELTKIKIKKGRIKYSLSSNIPAEIIYEYIISNAVNSNGVAFVQELTVPAAGGADVNVSGSFDLSGYTIDLKGANNNTYNTLSTLINMKLSENHPGDLLLNNNDSVKILNTISNVFIQSAEGYFGSQSEVINGSSTIEQMKNIVGGSLDIEQVNVDLNIVNGIGADATFSIQNLISKSNSNSTVALSHQVIGDQNFINRASKDGSNINSTNFSNSFNSSNSNIENWLENLPDSILYDLEFELNPLGNVSGHSDFINTDSPFEVNMDINMPLSFLANDLTLLDTIEVNTDNLKQIIDGKLKIKIDNGFPMSARLSLKNRFGEEELFSESPINEALTDNNGIVTEVTNSNHTITLSEESLNLLKTDKFLILKVKFNSPSSATIPISIYDYYKLKFNIVSNFTYQTNIE